MTRQDYKTDDAQGVDDRLNPASDSARDLYKQESGSIPDYDRANDGLDNHPVNSGDASGKSGDIGDKPTKNIDAAGEREREGGNPLNYTGGDAKKAKPRLSAKQAIKERGAIAFILAVLAGGGGIMGVLFSPGALIIDLKEKYTEKFNDQLAVMDDQSLLLLKKKFKGQGTIVGCTKISIRCKLNSMSDKQIKKMEKRGDIKVNTTGETTLVKGRNKIESFEYKGRTITADTLIREAGSDPEFRSALRKGYNPKLAGFADAAFTKLARKVGINKQQNLNGKTEKELKEEVRKAASGTAKAEIDAKVTSTEEDCNGGDGCTNGKRTVYKDSTGATISKARYDQLVSASSALSGELEARRTLASTGEIAAKGTLKGALTVTALGLGSVDSACTGYTLIRAVGFAAKYLGMLQLLRYWQIYGNTADVDKAGDGTPEINTFLGDIITSQNSEGKSGTDAYGYRWAVHDDTNGMPRSDNVNAESVSANDGIVLNAAEKQQIIVNDETTKYINGQLVSDNLLTDIVNLTGAIGSIDEIDATCGFIKSGWGQTIVIGAALAGAVVAFFSGGASLGWGAAAQTAVSVAITVAIAMLTPKLIDMASGTMINGEENGPRAINAATSGAGGMNTQTFMARGIPVLQKQDAVLYQEQTDKVLARYAEEDRLEHGPLDPTNKNTFLGSVVSNLLPYTTKMSSLGTSISTLASLTTNSLGGIFPRASAQDKMAQYNICQDRDYLAENAAADPFCNLRGGFVPEVMAIDSDVMLDYMVNNKFINEETGAPLTSDNEYATYLKDCADRSVPIGGFSEDNPDKGTKCIQGRSGPMSATKLNNSQQLATLVATKNTATYAQAATAFTQEDKYNMFRKMSVLVGVNDGMDNGEVAPPEAPAAGTAGGGAAVTGDARALALQVVANDNIQFVNPATEAQLKIFGDGGTVYDAKLRPMTVSKHLLGALLTNASKYKILINNIGFHEDRTLKENLPYQHPAGTAVDLNNIEIIGGASTGGSIELPTDAGVANQYATDFLAALPLNRGGVGQSDHGMRPTFPPGSVALNGSHLFPDAGNHLHIDARNRENLMDTE